MSRRTDKYPVGAVEAWAREVIPSKQDGPSKGWRATWEGVVSYKDGRGKPKMRTLERAMRIRGTDDEATSAAADAALRIAVEDALL